MDPQNRTDADTRRSPGLAAVYFVLRLIVTGLLFYSLIRRRYENALLCALSLLLFLMPAAVGQQLRIRLPAPMELFLLLFIFASEILGELGSCYLRFSHWDTMLHITSGFLTAAVGFSMIDILNRNSRIKFELSPLFCAVAAFCFSMTIGVLWEFFEFGMDVFFHTDMQKDTVLPFLSSTYLDPTASNVAVQISNIREMALNGQPLPVAGYLDMGLYDTMEDLLMNVLSAAAFSVIGYLDLRSGSGQMTRWLLPTLQDENSQ